jgi:hypothetical protein
MVLVSAATGRWCGWRRARVGATLLAGALVVGALAGCTPDDEGGEPAGTTAPPTTQAPVPGTTATTVPDDGRTEDEREVAEAVASFWRAFIGYVDPDSEAPPLERVAIDPALSKTRTYLDGVRGKGQYARRPSPGDLELHIGEILIEGDEAVLSDCIVDDIVVYDADGTVVSDAVMAERFRTVLRRTSSGWMVAEHDPLRSSEQLSECRGGTP